MLQKMAGGGALHTKFTIYYIQRYYLGIKLIGPNLFSRIEICFTCYPIYRDLHTKNPPPPWHFGTPLN